MGFVGMSSTARVVLRWCALLACVSVCWGGSSVHRVDAINVDDSRWVEHAAHASDPVLLVVALAHTPQAKAQLSTLLDTVSHPHSPNYGRYLSRDEVVELMRPPAVHVNSVVDWLKQQGVSEGSIQLSVGGDFLSVETTVAVAQTALNTTLSRYQSARGRSVVRVSRVVPHYSVPAAVAPFIDFIGNLLDFPQYNMHVHRPSVASSSLQQPQHQQAMAAVAAGRMNVTGGDWPNDCDKQVYGLQCQGWLTPGVIYARYQVPKSVPTDNTGNSMAVAAFDTEYYDDADLNSYSQACGTTPPVTIAHDYGGNDPTVCTDQFGCTESLMDVELIASMSPATPLSFFYLNEYSILDWVLNVSAMADPPLVHSISYGSDESSNPVDYVNRINVELQKLGVRGISVLSSAGDSGVWGQAGNGTRFQPHFPASSQYITAVGASAFAKPTIGDEIGVVWSGGGFSDVFSLPSYQSDAVSAYISSSSSLPPQSMWNAAGRAYPDISALGGVDPTPYCIFESGAFQGGSGTSASTPVVAGLIAYLNSVRLAKGGAPLGFLNPWLYTTLAETPDAFFDITVGNNHGGFPQGFTAAKGWDPVSGVGTPNIGKLVALL